MLINCCQVKLTDRMAYTKLLFYVCDRLNFKIFNNNKKKQHFQIVHMDLLFNFNFKNQVKSTLTPPAD